MSNSPFVRVTPKKPPCETKNCAGLVRWKALLKATVVTDLDEGWKIRRANMHVKRTAIPEREPLLCSSPLPERGFQGQAQCQQYASTTPKLTTAKLLSCLVPHRKPNCINVVARLRLLPLNWQIPMSQKRSANRNPCWSPFSRAPFVPSVALFRPHHQYRCTALCALRNQT